MSYPDTQMAYRDVKLSYPGIICIAVSYHYKAIFMGNDRYIHIIVHHRLHYVDRGFLLMSHQLALFQPDTPTTPLNALRGALIKWDNDS